MNRLLSSVGKISAILVVSSFMLAASPGVLADDTLLADDALLADRWWSEPAHGLRLRPPAVAEQYDHTSDGALVTFRQPGGLRLAVFIRKAESGINLKELREAAFDRFAFAYPSAVYINPKLTPPDRTRWAATMLAAEDQEGRDFRWGQVFIVIDDTHFAILEMEVSREDFDAALETLNAVLRSVSFMDRMELRQKRADQMLVGQAWLNETRERLKGEGHEPPTEQWFRVIEEGEDIGYRRVQFITDPSALKAEKLEPGLAVKEQMRVAAGGRVFDVAVSAYQSADRSFEMWEARTTLRKRNAGGQRTATWADTGFRTDEGIQATRQAPAELGAAQEQRANPAVPETTRWPTPPVAYLAQADLYRLLPHWHTLPEDACFYSYDLNSGNLAQRLISVSPGEDGGTIVTIRPTPSSGLQRLTYDAQGNLRRHEMADGRVFIPTTAEQIAALWDIGR
jgi:hypothetical protein